MKATELLLERSIEELADILTPKISDKVISSPHGTDTDLTSSLKNFLRQNNIEELSQPVITQKTESIPGWNYWKWAVVNFLWSIDPTPNHTYINWLIRAYNAAPIKVEDGYKVTEDLELYETLKKRNKLESDQKDINQIKTVDDLYNVVKEFKDTELNSRAEERKKEEQGYYDRDEAKLIHNDSEIKVVQPKSKGASCFFGKNTRWCTAATESNNIFDNYASKGPLYIILDKKDNARYQIQFKTESFMNEADRPFNTKELADKFPQLYKIFGKVADKGGYLDFNPNPSEACILKNLKRDPSNIDKIPHPTEDQFKMAIDSPKNMHFDRWGGRKGQKIADLSFLKWLGDKNRIPESVMKYAIDKNPQSIEYFAHASDDLIKYAMSKDKGVVRGLAIAGKLEGADNPDDVIYHAIKANPSCLGHLSNVSYDVMKKVLEENPSIIKEFTEQPVPEDLQKMVTKKNPNAIDGYLHATQNVKSLYTSLTGQKFRERGY